MNPQSKKSHWETIYSTKDSRQVGWYQQKPTNSLELIRSCGLNKSARIIDVGGGDSTLVDHLIQAGYRNLSVLDISEHALNKSQKRLKERADQIHWIHVDVTKFVANHPYDLWHDRAVFHFLWEESHIRNYLDAARKGVLKDGYLILGTFSEKGPKTCSGLPVNRYSLAQMQHLFCPSFNYLSGLNVDHQTPSGNVQNYNFGLFQKK
ncbi:MAG: class I SAM-dependent methyltransferase [Cyclobacteriaceae bacterium]